MAYSTKLLDQAKTLPGKKLVSEAIGVVIERVQDEVGHPRMSLIFQDEAEHARSYPTYPI